MEYSSMLTHYNFLYASINIILSLDFEECNVIMTVVVYGLLS